MVRKGSPVRVRQRALEKPLETGAFLVPGGADATSAIARGPHLGRISSKYPLGIQFEKGSSGSGRRGSASVCGGRPDDVERAVRHGDQVVEELALGKTVGVGGGLGDALDGGCL